MISTKRDLHVQRFTLAHELGHLRLGHPFKLDETIGFAGRNAPESRPIQERAADTFASELLGPKSLMLESAKRHRWNKQKLHQPDNIYQLSLRLGISYKATCWALVTASVLNRREAGKLEAEPVKDQKRALVPEELITNSWEDVWALTRADSETFLEAGPDDLFAVHVQDQASAGYLWQLVDTGTKRGDRGRTTHEPRSRLWRAVVPDSLCSIRHSWYAPARLRARQAMEWRNFRSHRDRHRWPWKKSVQGSRDEPSNRHWRSQHEHHCPRRPPIRIGAGSRSRRTTDMLVDGDHGGSRACARVRRLSGPGVSALLCVRQRFHRWSALPGRDPEHSGILDSLSRRDCPYYPGGLPPGWQPPKGVNLYRRESEPRTPAGNQIAELLDIGRVPVLGHLGTTAVFTHRFRRG